MTPQKATKQYLIEKGWKTIKCGPPGETSNQLINPTNDHQSVMCWSDNIWITTKCQHDHFITQIIVYEDPKLFEILDNLTCPTTS